MTPHRLFLAVVALAIAAAPAAAHDMWVEPSTFLPDPGEIVPIRLRVGQGLLGDPLPRDPQLLRDFVVEGPRGRGPVVGRDGSDPAGMVRAGAPGLLVVGYQSRPSIVSMAGGKFLQYLREEGLDAIAAARVQQNQAGAEVRDAFTRCAKALLVAGTPAPGAAADRRLGFEFELVAERNPYETADVPFQLWFRERPIAGVLVVAINRLHPSDQVTARTDAAGRVRLHLAPGGLWLVKAVHMVPAPDRATADYASYWASLTFQPEAAATGTR